MNHIAEVSVSDGRVDVRYVLDQAEIPTFQERGVARAERVRRKQAEVLRRLRVGRYVLSGRHDGGYAACERCGKHVPLSDLDALRRAVRELCGFACDFAHFPLVGACPDCEALR